ncbi:MAG: ParB/RepB/Spo0J family partition protein [Bacteroidetes bacterium]|nr:MAG: ParB/RepB/Spo0J family partition protein [Bacteroidota bacterium]
MAKKVKKKELGAGIAALLRNIETEPPEQQKELVRELTHTVASIPVEAIEVNPFQPRNDFDEESLQELAESIRVHGLIQPITVRRMAEGQYQLISGERRWRASKLAGLETIPAYVRLANDQEMLEMALVENIQREDLNAIEVAITFQRLIDECSLTHESLSQRVGKKRSTVTNFLRLLKLPPDIQKGLKEGRISMGHARALLGVEDFAVQSALYREIITEGLSVRETERRVQAFNQPQRPRARKPSLPDAYLQVQEQLRSRLGAKVQLKRTPKGRGQIVIPFADDDDLNRLLDLLEEDRNNPS